MAIDAGWYVDPLARFSGRYFDGINWTDQVSDNGALGTDPDWPPAVADDGASRRGEPTASSQRRQGGMLVPERREAGDRRQVNTPRHGLPERRKGDRRQRKIVIPKA